MNRLPEDDGNWHTLLYYSHTTPSPSPSRMYRYAGCDLGTGAIPCRRASAQVIFPFPLSSYRTSASPPAGASGALGPEPEGTEQTTGSMSVLSHPERMRSSAAASRRSTVSPYARRTSTTRPANQHLFRRGIHSAASLPLFSYRFA